MPIPRGESGVYLLTVRARPRKQQVPLPCSSSKPATACSSSCRSMTWQGRNPADDDGDGLPNMLDRGVGATVDRIMSATARPAGRVRQQEAPLLAYLDANKHRYDITTDVALARPAGPGPASLPRRAPRRRHALAAAAPGRAPARVRAARRHGSSRSAPTRCAAQVRVSRKGRLIHPTAPAEDGPLRRAHRPARAPGGDADVLRRRRHRAVRRRHRRAHRLSRASSRRSTLGRRPAPSRGSRRDRRDAQVPSSSARASARAWSSAPACPSSRLRSTHRPQHRRS